ncbi:DUF551 domain-containing protein [Klebsiella variicola subsp. variicola]|nr:DUF551 domain-containing protein [Klebsiella variicola subsp. variicola]
MTKSTITREQAEEAIDGLEGLISRGVQSVYLDIAIEGLRQLLFAMDQKPALHRYRRKSVEPYGPYPWHYEVFVDYPRPVECLEDEYFYAEPPVVTGFAVDGESECLPLDYLQGHKDGLEWAAQLAEANHPETGDWLYDDHIELAKAIRKGPDMPPVQPVPEYPETLPCPVLLEPGLRFGKGIKTSTMLAALARRAVYESDMAALSPEERAEFQVGIDDFKALIAQPAPVVPDDVLDALQKVARIRLDLNDFDGDRRGIADCLCDAEEALIEVVNRRAAMLQELQKSAGAEVICRSNENVQALNTIKATPALGSLPKTDEVQNTNSPVIPDGYVMVPMRLTAENGAKGALSGEFSKTKFVNCPECFGDDECETCDGSGRIEITVPVTWTTIKEIWAKGVEHFAAAPQSPGGDHATVPGKWIPVSERMPELGDWLVTDGCDFDVQLFNGEQFIPGFVWEDKITHWMPLPAAPQEVKGE